VVPVNPTVIPSTGCHAATVAAPGEVRVTTTSGGAARWYLRRVPPAYSSTRPIPVVFDLHGYSEGAATHEGMTDLGPFGDTHGFVTITPEGSGGSPVRWDNGLDTPDMNYIGDLLNEVGQTLCVDANRIYVTGLSNGAFLTSAIACRFSTRIAAVAPIAGIRDIAGCQPSRPVPVITIHGTADEFIRYDGTLGRRAAELPAPDGSGRTLGELGPLNQTITPSASIPTITQAWAQRNGCSTAPAEQSVAADVTLFHFSCPKGAEVELFRVNGGGHSWPGSAFSRSIADTVGPTTTSIDANSLIWNFFLAHPLYSH
jgi:polyhydroxybutyrate depolymerase